MKIERASPVQMRKALEVVSLFKSAGMLFVPVPVMNESEFNEKMHKVVQSLEKLLSGPDGS